MSKLKIKLEVDEYDELCRDLIDIAIELEGKDNHPILRILQLFLYAKWE